MFFLFSGFVENGPAVKRSVPIAWRGSLALNVAGRYVFDVRFVIDFDVLRANACRRATGTLVASPPGWPEIALSWEWPMSSARVLPSYGAQVQPRAVRCELCGVSSRLCSATAAIRTAPPPLQRPALKPTHSAATRCIYRSCIRVLRSRRPTRDVFLTNFLFKNRSEPPPAEPGAISL
jgi:hypothetical protein